MLIFALRYGIFLVRPRSWYGQDNLCSFSAPIQALPLFEREMSKSNVFLVPIYGPRPILSLGPSLS